MGIINQTHKNAIINGNFDIWQRGTSFVSPISGAYHTDRFDFHHAGTMAHTIVPSTNVPTLSEAKCYSNYSLKVDCTTAQAIIGANDHNHTTHHIEGYNFIPFVGKIATLSFWVKATKTGIYCVAFRSNGIDISYVTEYTVNSSNTWEKKEITLTFDYSGGTWDYTNGNGLRMTWVLAAGTIWQTTKDTWLTGNFLATSNQVNACDNVANNFQLSQVQFELGETASPFESRTIQQELELCQRYYEKSYTPGVAPGSITNGGCFVSTPPATSVGNVSMQPIFRVVKRVSPTVTTYSPGTGTSGNLYDVIGAVDRAAAIVDTNEKSCRIYNSGAVTPNQAHIVHYTADAEL